MTATPATAPLGRLDRLTFRANVRRGRHGWLRLTPAYSLHLVTELLDQHVGADGVVLDPFCGTGTTALACAERGVRCETTDINPFLVWLARVKAAKYSAADILAFRTQGRAVTRAMKRSSGKEWVPALHKIERWWSPAPLGALARGRVVIRAAEPTRARNLLDLAFCRASIESADVSFAHQSMSFRAAPAEHGVDEVVARWERAVEEIALAAASRIRRTPTVHLADARTLDAVFPPARFTAVITSPPYPNRMSYVRELRPYMYWLGYLEDARDAGELDWRAIGGTWGSATSNVAKWSPAASSAPVPHEGFDAIVGAIRERSDVLARYVDKYFHDTVAHVASLSELVARGGSLHYIVGNSKFYDVMLPVEAIYASIFEASGFANARFRAIRKRSSKKELFEFVVSADKPPVRRAR